MQQPCSSRPIVLLYGTVAINAWFPTCSFQSSHPSPPPSHALPRRIFLLAVTPSPRRIVQPLGLHGSSLEGGRQLVIGITPPTARSRDGYISSTSLLHFRAFFCASTHAPVLACLYV
ncbi:hypothetical protein GALMADRAFT_161136 [Galerina marginata CBS 339.88]|uniref:Uncharacterized protein n=1 Tax=Galerina marginata (strain CBS 339.88) TaxID=685588 RepID=A0A067SBE0_GALM3|nr:hypothetical protein GALMADRAFT_161136 [Galerina marginata CBS 339.88]